MDTQSGKGRDIYAIVLSYDANIIFVDNLLCKMQKLWPESGFIYRIPYNNNKPVFLAEKYTGLNLEFIETPTKIKQTVLRLIEDIRDEEWIYWCIDDKFPVDLNRKKANQVLGWVKAQEDSDICGVSFARVRRLKDENYLDVKNQIQIGGGLRLIKRKSFKTQFWMHQFFRAKIIMDVFTSFPDYHFQAKLMDTYMKQCQTDFDNKFYVTNKNLVVFNESASRGIASESLRRSLKSCSIDNYANKKFNQVDMVIGWRPSFKSLFMHYASFKTRVTRVMKKLKNYTKD